MSKAVHGPRRRADSLQSQIPCRDGDQPCDQPARRAAIEGRYLLDRILNIPRLEQVVPRLQPDLLHRVIQTCGLEDCGELVALVTPEQLANIFDLDLWHAAQPGLDEQFDADRFGVWLEVLLEAGAAVAAQKLASMDVGLVVAGLAQHMLVYALVAVTPYQTLDGEEMDVSRVVDDGLTSEVGGYLLVARRDDSWEAIVDVLMSLDEGHPDYFHQVMGMCRTLSNSGFEIDGLDDLLSQRDQVMFDQSVDRDGRREKQGYVTPAQARAFLQMSRQVCPQADATPPVNPLARAYFRDLERMDADVDTEPGLLAAGSEVLPASEETGEAVATVFEVLLEAGVLEQAPLALLPGPEHAARLGRIQAYMQFLLDTDQPTYSTRREELAYLANTLMSGCAIQSRPFTAREASDAVLAVCNLGLENWPSHWLHENATAAPGSFLIDHDLVSVFQVGWGVLYNDVSSYTAEQLIVVLTRMRCDDKETQRGLDVLRLEMAKYRQLGAPWRARHALDVIATIDMVAWAVLRAVLDECPVLHAGIGALRDSRTRSIRVSDFEFISENSQIASVRDFIQSLPETLALRSR